MKSVMLLPISLGIGLVAVMFGTFVPHTTWTVTNEMLWNDISTSGLSQNYYTAYRISNETQTIDREQQLESLIKELQEAQQRLAVLQGQKLA